MIKSIALFIVSILVAAAADFSFIVTSDMQMGYNENQRENLRDAMGCIARKHGDADFMISPGDNTPEKDIHQIIKDSLGDNFRWYPLVGNHESDTDSDQVYIKKHIGSLPGIGSFGPAHAESTMYSFDIEQVHFVCINVYFDGTSEFSSWKTSGVGDACYQWLRNDLETTDKEAILAFGHVPAFALRDEDTQMEYQMDSDLSLSGGVPENRDRFWELLKIRGVIAYICGHQHSYYSEQFDGVYQFNPGAISDNSASYDTYIRVAVTDTTLLFEAWREYESDEFTLKESIVYSINGSQSSGTKGFTEHPLKFRIKRKAQAQKCFLLNGRRLPHNILPVVRKYGGPERNLRMPDFQSSKSPVHVYVNKNDSSK